ncbi:hypothetical protein OBBRIDRAFT_790950 [Obba rivulosa]|uniref:Uncharacterized protein n=1 Tax=Obba rivulosa TaxID=1052685 RepID=A0A8E2B2G1_9APHY|nr:hypothetical protein OBBRIDRAFT_790950 [Obba rivulosa]
MQAGLIKFMESVKERRLEKERGIRQRQLDEERSVLLRRRVHAFWDWIRQDTVCGQDNAEMLLVDYAEMPEVRTVIDAPGDANLTSDDFLPLLPILSALRERWP